MSSVQLPCLTLNFAFKGRGMNAAFAVGRLLDMSPGKERLLNCKETEKMVYFRFFTYSDVLQKAVLWRKKR